MIVKPNLVRFNLAPCTKSVPLFFFQAITRIKLNFLDQISKFWELQGTSLRIPVFGHKALDLYTLHELVHTNDCKLSYNLK